MGYQFEVEGVKYSGFVQIDGQEGYFINPIGLIYSSTLKRFRRYSSNGNYTTVQIKGKGYLIHRLIAFHFIPNPNNYPILNHIDGNKLNNSLDNLEWCTYSHNLLHALKTGLTTPQKGEEKVTAKLKEENLNEIYELLLNKVSLSDIGKRYNICQSSLHQIVTGERWKHVDIDWDSVKYKTKTTSKAKGIWYIKQKDRWFGQLIINKKIHRTLGFKNEEDAILALSELRKKLSKQ